MADRVKRTPLRRDDPFWQAVWNLEDAGVPGQFLHWVLAWGGYGSVEALRAARDQELLALRHYGPRRLRALRGWLATQAPPPPPPPWWVAEE
jgi:hypothetical protein